MCIFCSRVRDFCCSGAFSAAREIPGTNAGPGDLESRAPGGACEQGGPTQVSRAPNPVQTRKQTEKAHRPGRLLCPSATFTGELMSIHVIPGNHVNHSQTRPLFRAHTFPVRLARRAAGHSQGLRSPQRPPPPPPSVCSLAGAWSWPCTHFLPNMHLVKDRGPVVDSDYQGLMGWSRPLLEHLRKKQTSREMARFSGPCFEHLGQERAFPGLNAPSQGVPQIRATKSSTGPP